MFSSLVKLFQKGLNRRLLPSHLIEVPVKINSDSRKTIDLKKKEKKDTPESTHDSATDLLIESN